MSTLPETPELYVVTAHHLNLRVLPANDAVVLRVLPRGDFVTWVGVDGAWSQVSHQRGPEFSRVTGWVASKYLTPEHDLGAPVAATEEFPWMPIALSERGVMERPGPADHPRIVEYLRSTELDAALASNDETPWCSGFVNWCVEKSGLAGTNSAAASSWLGWGRAIQTARRGCITVLSRKGGAHVGFYAGQSELTYGGARGIQLLGGNQSNQVCVADYDPARLLGYRVPPVGKR